MAFPRESELYFCRTHLPAQGGRRVSHREFCTVASGGGETLFRMYIIPAKSRFGTGREPNDPIYV